MAILYRNSLRKVRLKKGKTMKELAECTGLAISTIAAYEKYKKPLSNKAIKEIAIFLDVPEKSIKVREQEDKVIVKEEEVELIGCSNKTCLLNKNMVCQSVPIAKGEYCQNKSLVKR